MHVFVLDGDILAGVNTSVASCFGSPKSTGDNDATRGIFQHLGRSAMMYDVVIFGYERADLIDRKPGHRMVIADDHSIFLCSKNVIVLGNILTASFPLTVE